MRNSLHEKQSAKRESSDTMHIYGIDANLLISLDALLREGSVTKAAQRVGLTQSAMSHALGRLRDQLGDPLLVRAGRQMVLTPRAEALAPRVARVVREMAQIFASEKNFDPSSLERSFAIRTTDHIQFVLMPELDTILNAEAPRVDLVLTPVIDQDVEALRNGSSDIVIGVFDDLPPDVHQQALFTDRFVCLVREGHPAAGAGLTLTQYGAMAHVLVAHRGGKPGSAVDRLLAEHGIKRRVARAVPHFLIAPFIVARSDAIVTMSERLAQRLVPLLGGLQILEPPLALEPYTLSMAWHERYDGDPAHRWLRDAMLRAASRLPALERRNARSPTQPDAPLPASPKQIGSQN